MCAAGLSWAEIRETPSELFTHLDAGRHAASRFSSSGNINTKLTTSHGRLAVEMKIGEYSSSVKKRPSMTPRRSHSEVKFP
jgi:hypothetical protein